MKKLLSSLIVTAAVLLGSTAAMAQTATPTLTFTRTPTRTPTLTSTRTPTSTASPFPHSETRFAAFTSGTFTLSANMAGDCTAYALNGLQYGDLLVVYPPVTSGAIGITFYPRVKSNNFFELCGGTATVTGEVWTYVWWDRTQPIDRGDSVPRP